MDAMTGPPIEFSHRYKNALVRALMATYHGDDAEAKAAIQQAAAYENFLSTAVRDQLRKEAKERADCVKLALENAPEGCELQGVYETKEEAEAAMAALAQQDSSRKTATGGASPSTKSRSPCRGKRAGKKVSCSRKSAASAVARIEKSVLTAKPDGGPNAWHCPDCDSAQSWDEMCECGLTCDD
jgi:hypothetical protein